MTSSVPSCLNQKISICIQVMYYFSGAKCIVPITLVDKFHPLARMGSPRKRSHYEEVQRGLINFTFPVRVASRAFEYWQ